MQTYELPASAGADEQACDISVVIPCLNEAETIGTCVAKARAGLEEIGLSGEIVVADNGSTDGSRELATAAGARVVEVPRRGYGAALMAGIADARGRFVVMGDADDTYDFSKLQSFVAALEQGYDLVMGNRFAGGIAEGAMPRLNRLVGNPILSGVGRLLFRSPVGDFHCGLRAFRRDSILALGLRSPGMEFASEMVIKATLANYRITEVPTTLSPGTEGRRPHLRPLRDGWRHLRLLLLYSPRWLFLYPGVALFLAGLGSTIALLPGPLKIGGVRFDVHTLLYAETATILGFQLVVVAFFAKLFGIRQGLLRENARLTRLSGMVSLERGLVLGAALALAGLAGSLYAIVDWGQRSFGALNFDHTMRIAIPSAGLLVIGFQTIVASFFLSFLRLDEDQT